MDIENKELKEGILKLKKEHLRDLKELVKEVHWVWIEATIRRLTKEIKKLEKGV